MALKKKLSVTYVPSKQDNTRVAKTPYKHPGNLKSDEEMELDSAYKKDKAKRDSVQVPLQQKRDSAAMARNVANHQAAIKYYAKNKKKK